MASSSHLFVSSSPTPHNLHTFRRFAPQPSPLGHATNLFERSALPGPTPSFDFDEEHSLEYDHDELEEGDEDDQEDHPAGAEEDDEEEELEDDDESQPGEQGSMSPTLDVSFASSMSIGTAPPTPSLNANRRRQQRPLGQPTPPPANRHVNHPVASTSAFLPAHLFAPTPNAHPPSSSPCRMDISPPAASRRPPPTLAAQFFNPPKPSTSSDPFAIQSRSCDVLSSSPPTDRPTIGLKKTKSRSRMISGFFEPRPDSQAFATSDEDSDRMGSDGMEIDSPGYAQRTRNIFQPLVVVDDSVQSAQRAPRSGRSGSQGSIGKRSRSDEDDYEDDGPLSARSSLGSEMHSIQMNHPRTRSDDGHTTGRHHLSPAQPHSGSGRTRTMPETACQFLAGEASSRNSSGFQLPSSPASASGALFEDPSMSSSPCQMMSPSVKAAAKLTLGRKAGERSLSGFKFPVTKASTGAQVHVRAGSNGSTNVRNLSYQPSAGGSLGASTLAGFPRRPALGVVQSAATLFSRHTSTAVPTLSAEGEGQGVGSLRQRDAVGRPASKSRRAISFAATEGHTLMSGAGDDDEEDEEEDGLAGLNCSPAPRGVSHTWPKFGLNAGGHTRIASETVVGVAQPVRKRSPPPPPLNSLVPPSRGPLDNVLQSPSRLSPLQQKAMLATRTIESPVGMGFSEKERAGKILPCHKVSDDGLMRISPKTMDELLDGRYDRAISEKIVIDCRFKYEYEGGHIKDAINVREKDHIEEVLLSATSMGLLSPPEPSESGKCDGNGLLKKVVLVFHCEYSAMRAPTIAKHLREKDRHLNMPHYPALHYPEVYILEGGYAKYHAHSPHNCDGDYVPMDDPLHRFDRHADLNMFRSKEAARFVKKKSSKKIIRNSTNDENVSTSPVIEEECSPCKKEDNTTTRKAAGGGPMRRIDSNSMRILDERRR